jgi:phage/plasmid-associated DNA primase
VLDLTTIQRDEAKPEHRFTWRLPFDYDPTATCPTIDAWLPEAQDGDPMRVKVLKAYLRAIVTGRVDLQRFLELIGLAGSGKGTLQKQAMGLVGLENVFVTELKQLETNRFETSNIVGKRLTLITDSERYTGSVATLKGLTGGDPLRAERKYDPDAHHFVPEAMVIIAANEPI